MTEQQPKASADNYHIYHHHTAAVIAVCAKDAPSPAF